MSIGPLARSNHNGDESSVVNAFPIISELVQTFKRYVKIHEPKKLEICCTTEETFVSLRRVSFLSFVVFFMSIVFKEANFGANRLKGPFRVYGRIYHTTKRAKKSKRNF